MITKTCDLVERIGDIPSLPIVFTRVNEAVNNPRSSIADIGKIISEDPGLSVRLLRIVNSALYGFPSKIETISRAVTIVGTQQLRDLALATTVIKLFRGISQELVDMESFWRHSVACGIASRVLATFRREANVERFFAAGILHDIGRLLICLKEPELTYEALTRAKASGEPLYRVEAEVLGFDHSAIGGTLVQAWKLPASLEEVLTYHHVPSMAVRYAVEATVIHVADIITHAMQLGNSGETLVPPLEEQAWERLGLSTSVLSPAMEQVDRQYRDAVQMVLPE
jgi:HD-like signal output (HDOD) protein